MELDRYDRAILKALQADGRMSNQELADAIGLSPSPCLRRVRALEEAGLITGYRALVDARRLGLSLMALISISMDKHTPERFANFEALVGDIPEVLECHHVTGEFDFLLKAVVRNRQDLERFVVNRLTPIPGVARINTSLALSETKSTTALPLPANSPHGD